MADEPVSHIRNEYLRAYNLHNADPVLTLCADDAVLLRRAFLEESPKSANGYRSHLRSGQMLETITATRQKSARTIGYGTGQTKRLVGQEVDPGRYLIVLEKRRGKWLIAEHASFNVH